MPIDYPLWELGWPMRIEELDKSPFFKIGTYDRNHKMY